MSIAVLNTDAGLTGKTLLDAEDTQTITGAKTFDRDPNPPFVVTSGSAVVPNLDADKLDGKDATAFLLLDGTQSMTAALPLGATGQITFPATQNASSGANTLDDYEEGSWTPVLGGSGGTSGQTYGATSGRYTKIGRLVFVEFSIILTAKGTITTAAQIQGLPFTPAAATSACVIPQFANMATNWITLGGIWGGGTAITLYGMQAAAASSLSLTTTDIANNTTMVGSMTFTV